MNRALLLIIADFLLLSLLALARFDIEEETPDEEAQEVAVQDQMATQEDMLEVLRSTLDQEQAERERIARELEQTSETLESREQQFERSEEELARLAEIARREAEERARLAENLEQTDAERRQLASTLDAEVERLRRLQANLAEREAALEETTQRAEELAEAKSLLEQEKRVLDTRIQVAQAEKFLLQENLESARARIETERVERERAEARAERLAQGVSQLAQSSDALQKQIQDNTPQTVNEVYNNYLNNRVAVSFRAVTSGIFGPRTREYRARSMVVTDGREYFVLLHTGNTPFDFEDGGSLTEAVANLELNNVKLPVREVQFLSVDPRVIAIKVHPDQLRRANVQATPLAKRENTLRFSDAVVIGRQEGFYGQTEFRLTPVSDRHLVMEGTVLSSLAGNFSPTEGDLVFARTGEFLGFMVNDRFAAIVDVLFPVERISLGDQYQPETGTAELRKLDQRLQQLPREMR